MIKKQNIYYSDVLKRQNLDVFGQTIQKNAFGKYDVMPMYIDIHLLDPDLTPFKDWYVLTSGKKIDNTFDNTFENIFYVMQKQIEDNKEDTPSGISPDWIIFPGNTFKDSYLYVNANNQMTAASYLMFEKIMIYDIPYQGYIPVVDNLGKLVQTAPTGAIFNDYSIADSKLIASNGNKICVTDSDRHIIQTDNLTNYIAGFSLPIEKLICNYPNWQPGYMRFNQNGYPFSKVWVNPNEIQVSAGADRNKIWCSATLDGSITFLSDISAFVPSLTLSKITLPNSVYRGYMLRHNSANETIEEIAYIPNANFDNYSIYSSKIICNGFTANRYLVTDANLHIAQQQKIPYQDVDLTGLSASYLLFNNANSVGALQYITNSYINNNTISINKIDNTGTSTGKKYSILNTGGTFSLSEITSTAQYIEDITTNNVANRGKIVKINATSNATEFVSTLPDSTITTSSYAPGQSNWALFGTTGILGCASSVGLQSILFYPYGGSAYNFVRVNSAGTGHEYINFPRNVGYTNQLLCIDGSSNYNITTNVASFIIDNTLPILKLSNSGASEGNVLTFKSSGGIQWAAPTGLPASPQINHLVGYNSSYQAVWTRLTDDYIADTSISREKLKHSSTKSTTYRFILQQSATTDYAFLFSNVILPYQVGDSSNKVDSSYFKDVNSNTVTVGTIGSQGGTYIYIKDQLEFNNSTNQTDVQRNINYVYQMSIQELIPDQRWSNSYIKVQGELRPSSNSSYNLGSSSYKWYYAYMYYNYADYIYTDYIYSKAGGSSPIYTYSTLYCAGSNYSYYNTNFYYWVNSGTISGPYSAETSYPSLVSANGQLLYGETEKYSCKHNKIETKTNLDKIRQLLKVPVRTFYRKSDYYKNRKLEAVGVFAQDLEDNDYFYSKNQYDIYTAGNKYTEAWICLENNALLLRHKHLRSQGICEICDREVYHEKTIHIGFEDYKEIKFDVRFEEDYIILLDQCSQQQFDELNQYNLARISIECCSIKQDNIMFGCIQLIQDQAKALQQQAIALQELKDQVLQMQFKLKELDELKVKMDKIEKFFNK